MLLQEAAAAPAVQYGSANATLAAALLAGDFYAPESPAPVSKRPAHTVRLLLLLLLKQLAVHSTRALPAAAR